MLGLRESARVRRFEDGKLISETTAGDSFWRNVGQWMHLNRLIDWKNYWYRKMITYPSSDEVAYYVSHDLREHRGHGSTKP
jgi:hypothetical protein